MSPFTALIRLQLAAASGLDALIARAAAGPRDSGQGTVEYVALILLVAVVLAGVVAATRKSSIGSGEIGATIVKKIKGALDTVK
jgi:hypothetical protein